MIINKPRPADFEKQSIQYLVQAIDLIAKNEENFNFAKDIGYDEKEYWRYHQGILNNSLTLLFLSLENLIKKEICKVSPLLLLADEPKKWSSRSSDKKFSDLFILQFDDLLALYQELGLGQISDQTANKLEELRKKRNQITHGITEDNIGPKYILEIFHTLMVHIWGAGVWWKQLKEYLFNEPLFGIYDSDHERALVTTYIDFFINYLGKKRTGELLGRNFKSRNYYCPECHYWLNRDFEVAESKYAFLEPNTPQSKKILCVVCEQTFQIKREECLCEDCNGNVISSENTCLTCFEDQEYYK